MNGGRETNRGPRLGMTFERMAIGLLFVAFAFRAALMPAQNDTFWHLRAGADIWRTGHVPITESYSFTAAGLPWPDHEWLWQLFVYGCHLFGGMPLLTCCAMAFIVGAIWLVYRLMVGPAITRFILMVVGLSMSSCVWVLRPQIVTLFCIPALVTLLVRERYWPIPLLFLVWANVHGGVSLGGLVLVAATVTATLRWQSRRTPEDRRRLLALSLVLPLSGLATCMTPLGFGIFRFVWESTSRLYAARISEWQPTIPNQPFEATFCAAVLALGILLVKRRRALVHGDPPRVDGWGDWAITAGALVLLPPALRSVRNTAPFLMLAIPLASRLLGTQFRFRFPWRTAPRPPSPDHPIINLALFGGTTAAAIVVIALAWGSSYKRLGWRPVSEGALEAVRACEGPLYNHYNDGGQLIWFVPEKPVFIDSRQDPYPLPFLLDFIAVEHETKPYRPLFDRWGIRCVFLSVESPTVKALDKDGWSSRFRDKEWAVLSAPPGR